MLSFFAAISDGVLSKLLLLQRSISDMQHSDHILYYFSINFIGKESCSFCVTFYSTYATTSIAQLFNFLFNFF